MFMGSTDQLRPRMTDRPKTKPKTLSVALGIEVFFEADG